MSNPNTKNELNQNGKEIGDFPRSESIYQQTFVPLIDIWEGEEGLVLQADMPGVNPENLDVRFEDSQLTIHGRVGPRHQDIHAKNVEYNIGDFHRTFTIGEAIDPEKISAEMSQGVLTLHLPKSEKLKPRRIAVNAR